MVRGTLKFGLLLLLSVAILAVMVCLTGVEATLNSIREAGFAAFLMMGAIPLLFIAFQAMAMDALSRPIGHRIAFPTLMKAVTSGLAMNIVTPSSYLGGEPIKVVYLGRKTGLPYGQIAGTVLLGKYLEALGFILVLGLSIAGSVVSYWNVLFTGTTALLGAVLVVLALLSPILCAFLWWSLAHRRQPLARLLGLAGRLFPRAATLRKLTEHCREVETQASRVFLEEGDRVFRAFGLHVLTNLISFSRPLVFFMLGWKTRLSFGELSLLFVVFQTMHVVQITPSAVGTLDGAMFAALALGQIAITDARCAAFLLCMRFWDFAIVAVGSVLAARVGASFFSGKTKGGPRMLTTRDRMKLLLGRLRRLYLNTFRRKYVKAKLAQREGQCLRCGVCCRMAVKCRWLVYDSSGMAGCRNYQSWRPVNCRTFPIDERDIADRDMCAPDKPCGFRFRAV